MKILVAIACYGSKNLKFLEALLAEYRRTPFKVDLVVLSNEPKELGKDVEVIVGLPAKNPWSLPFGHKRLFAERVNHYDLFIYSEDDTPLTERNLRMFLDAVEVLPRDHIAGFLRYETGPDGARHISSAHGRFHWRPESARQIGGETFAQFTNAHSACFVLTRGQLERALTSGGFLCEPYEAEYDMLCSAATDPYTRCGMTKVVNISRLEDSLLPHLPNKYVGIMGTPYPVFLAQVEALKQVAAGKRPATNALPEIRPPLGPPFVKSYYEPCSQELVGLLPKHARSVLSLGMGSGLTECELVRRGLKVAALPLDSVICADAETKGVQTVYGTLEQGPKALRGRKFDCLLISNLLYLQPEPAAVLSEFAPLVAPGGCFLMMEPNCGNVQARAGRLLGKPRYKALAEKRVTAVTLPRLRRWLSSIGFGVKQTLHLMEEPVSRRDQVLRALPSPLGSAAIVLRAERRS